MAKAEKLAARPVIRRYAHKVLPGIGHNPPQEAPGASAAAILEVASHA